MTIPLLARIFWPSTVASIPTNWSRDINFDSRLSSGVDAGINPGTTGGSTTHTHTLTSHDHGGIFLGHAHTLRATGAVSSTTLITLSGPLSASNGSHSHTDSSVGFSTGPTISGTTITLLTSSALPLSIETIVLKPDNTSQDIPANALVVTDSSTFTTDNSNWSIADGTGGTVNADQRYFVGAANASDGGSLVGTTAHTHSESGSHTHIAGSHNHPDSSFGGEQSFGGPLAYTQNIRGAGNIAKTGVHHKMTAISSVIITINNNSVTSGVANNDVPSLKMLGVQNKGSVAELPNNVIIPYTGTSVQLDGETDWHLCDGTNGTPNLISKYVKSTKITGQIGDVVGTENTHFHTLNHTHTTVTHNHTGTAAVSATDAAITGRGGPAGSNTHTHLTETMLETQISTPNDTNTTLTEDKRSSWIEVLWIKRTPLNRVSILGGNILGGNIAA